MKMSDSILAKSNGKHKKMPTKNDLLNAYLSLEEHVVLLIFCFNSYLNHTYN